MRTTISISDDLLRRAKLYAASRSLGLGRALEELISRGLDPGTVESPAARAGEIVPFALPSDSPRVTTRRVRELENAPD